MSDTPVPVVAEASDVAATVAVEDNTSKSTLFVRGLPYDATSAQLEEFFSEVGPVRSCFVVLDRSAEQEAAESSVASGEETGIAAAAAKAAKTAPKNRGYGFVQFVLPEDADKALIELRSTKFLKQKPLLMEKAKKRTHEEEGKPKKEFKPKPKTDKPKKEEAEEPKEKNYSFQTVVLKGLGKDITKKHIYKRVRKVGDVKEVIYPVTVKAEESTGEANGEEKVEEGTAHVIYNTSALAASAVKALDGHIFKSCALHATLLASPAVYKRCRLIIRNLPWKYREQELRALFTKFGTVHEINLPRKFEGGPLRGFGFVQMENLEATEKAVQALNGTEHHGRTIAVDWALAKDRFEESEANSGANAEVEETSEEAAQEDQDVEIEGATAEDGDEEEGDENDDEDEEEEGDDDEDDDAELDLDHLKGSDDEEAEDSDEDENMDEEGDEEALAALDAEEAKEKEQSKMTLPDPSEGTTLFIRNLDFEATKDDLFELFRHWGKLRYCRVTMDHETGRSRGTGFVCFYNRGAADNCMAGADKVTAIVNPIQAENDRKKKNNFVKHTILQPDLPEDLAVKFTLNGRVLNVVRAVDKTSAVSLLEAGQHKREREDRRNLYLMREGVIFPDSPAAASILPGELSKRQASFSARRALLARNPSLFISKTRLSIRNLPLKLDEKELRKLGVQAVQKFKNEVKDGKRAHLTPEEQAEGWDKRVFIKQAKVIRSKDRVDGDTQQLRSKGYGFLEYSTHSHALAGLRWLNNNPSLFGEKKCLIVEFSIENVMVNKQRSERETRQQTKRTRGGNEEEEEHEEEHAPEKKRPRKSIHEGGGRDHDRSESRGGFRGGRGRGGSDRGAPRGGSRGGFRGGARGGSSSRGGFGDREGSRGGFGGRGGSRGGFGDRGGSRGGFGGRGGSRGGFGDRGGSRGGFGGRGGSRGGRGDARGSGRGGRGGRGRGRD